jgi:hypothetical protein
MQGCGAALIMPATLYELAARIPFLLELIAQVTQLRR